MGLPQPGWVLGRQAYKPVVSCDVHRKVVLLAVAVSERGSEVVPGKGL